jgi:hypothetical protein
VTKADFYTAQVRAPDEPESRFDPRSARNAGMRGVPSGATGGRYSGSSYRGNGGGGGGPPGGYAASAVGGGYGGGGYGGGGYTRGPPPSCTKLRGLPFQVCTVFVFEFVCVARFVE